MIEKEGEIGIKTTTSKTKNLDVKEFLKRKELRDKNMSLS